MSGEVYGLMGPNGSGKTTLMKVSAGLLKPDEGRVRVLGLELYNSGRESRLVKDKVGFMFQENLLIPSLTLWENVELPMIINRRPKKTRKGVTGALLDDVGVLELADRRPGEVSGGERRRTALARALVNGPELLFLDEPTSSLDTRAANKLMNIVRSLNKNEVTIIVSTHDRYIAEQLDQIVYIRDGTIIDSYTTGER
jgi:ABC-type multidrug transport system ATPase subunit